MIRVQDLTKRYGDRCAVDRITFTAEKGQILGFLGPNGAGKSTTMRILTGFLPPSSGAAEVAGFDLLTQPDEVRRRIGYLPENPPLYTEMTVRAYLRFVARLKGLARGKVTGACDAAIEQMGLSEVADRLLAHLSKGFRQRVGLAQALVHDPEVLILDEPTAGVDIEIRRSMWEFLRQINAAGTTIILTTHYLEEAESLCRHVAIIDEGVIIEENAVLSMGVYIGMSTKIYDRETGEITYGRVPAGAVVVPGSLPSACGKYSLYCAVIVKKVDAQTRAKTGINELLRGA